MNRNRNRRATEESQYPRKLNKITDIIISQSRTGAGSVGVYVEGQDREDRIGSHHAEQHNRNVVDQGGRLLLYPDQSEVEEAGQQNCNGG
jgi:hypothetical protein